MGPRKEHRLSTTAGQRAASVKDVASLAGVSLGTVSNVLNRPDRVSDTTRAKVERAMASLGFVRNESARQLRVGKSSVLAYILLDAGNPFFMDVSRGIEEAAEEAGLSLFICNSHQDLAHESSYLTRLEQLRVSGVLITPVDPHSPLLDELPERGTPVVLVDRTREGEPVDHCSVSVDDHLGGRLAAEHLIELGHTRIAFVGGPDRLGQVRDRRAGARDALVQAGLDPADLVEMPTTELTVAQGREAGGRIAGISRASRPTAAFCANDLLALGLLQRCVELGVRVPEDLAVVGYDDIDFAAAAAVPLTSVRQPRYELGQAAARLVLDEQDNPEHEHQRLRFEPVLVARRSTRHG